MSKNPQKAEIGLLVMVWLLIVAIPMVINYQNNLEWSAFFSPYNFIFPLFILFVINRWVLVPRFLFKEKRVLYGILVAGSIAIGALSLFLINQQRISTGQFPPGQFQRPMPRPNGQQPGSTGSFRPAHPPGADRLGANRPGADRPGFRPPVGQVARRIPPYANLVMFSVLLLGFDAGLRSSFRLAKTEEEKTKLEKENVASQLAFLRSQVSPHFFMNTLNNIHSLIDVDTEEAKTSVISLSKLMRHLLYKSELGQLPIKDEMDFMRNYVELMRLRFSERVRICLDIPTEVPDQSIPPMLFTSYLENAFKHGISYEKESFIEISVKFPEEGLSFEIRNSNPGHRKEGPSGIGTENALKRLDLLYKNRYDLKVTDKDGIYHLRLKIPL